jgi:hypothetical protein
MYVWTQDGMETLARGPPSMSSSMSVVDAVGPPAVPPRGPPSTSSSTSVVDAVEPAGSNPQGARHQHLLHPRWWPLLDPPAAPTGGPTINVFFSLGGGHC